MKLLGYSGRRHFTLRHCSNIVLIRIRFSKINGHISKKLTDNFNCIIIDCVGHSCYLPALYVYCKVSQVPADKYCQITQLRKKNQMFHSSGLL